MKYLQTNATSKEGINFVRNIVDNANCIFNEVPQQNDLGIDVHIEFIKNESPVNSMIAIQIKSGNSFYNKKNGNCFFLVNNHYSYWKNYQLAVLGIVYIPQLAKAYWIDIKKYFEDNGEVSKIIISPNLVNEFTDNTFRNIILQSYSKQTPTLSYSEVITFLNSDIEQEFDIGLEAGFVHYSNKNEFWDLAVSLLFIKNKNNISHLLLYVLSCATNGIDVWHSSRCKYEAKNLAYAKILLQKIDKENIVKMLLMFDNDIFIARGNVGSSIESIISNAENIENKLLDITYSKELDIEVREYAVNIYASLRIDNLLNKLEKIQQDNGELDVYDTINIVEQFGKVYFYL